MKRFIRYLYEYGEGRRMRNVGFAKLEFDEPAVAIHIHGKGLRLEGETKLFLYLIYEDEGKCIGIPWGETRQPSPALNCNLDYTKESIRSYVDQERICGAVLEAEGGRRFAVTWNDAEPDICQMQQWKAPVEAPMELPEQAVVEVPTQRQQDQDVLAEQDEDESGSRRQGWKITKIQRNEISILPRCEWRLANNNFLLHGYYNYRHLVLVDDGETLRLGVPGIYHEKEAQAARAFGFTEFIGEEDINLLLEPEECDNEQQFGYWCRQVRRPVM